MGRAGIDAAIGGAMSRRTIHGVILNAVLLVGSAFYLLSPGVFAYVGEVRMTYGYLPIRLARTAPARITARLFDRYNANNLRTARLKARLSCYLSDDGATPTPHCGHELRNGQSVAGPPTLKLPSGLYLAQFKFGARNGCSKGDTRIQVLTLGQLGAVQAEDTAAVEPGTVLSLPFRVHLMDAALSEVEFKAIGISGCVLLTSVDWVETAAGPP
jgi:hypothetical protein